MSDKIEKIIDALRKKILESAIRGELVPQNPDDEPACVLLERIAEEREKLIREKKIKKPKTTSRIFRRDGHFYESINGGEPTCIDDDIPFEIPDSWEWCRLKSICSIATGKKDANYGSPDGEYPFFTCAKEPIKCKSYSFEGESLLLAGNGDIGNISYYSGKFEAYQRTYVLQSYVSGYLQYIHIHLLYNWVEYNNEKMFGSTIPYIRLGNIEEYLVALPPVAEQSRILLAAQKREELVSVLQNSRSRYKRILSETPTSLRQQLIHAAIQGQLVPQNPDDEPARLLLERISQERITKLGKKAAKSMSRIERRGSKTYELFPDGSEKDISDEIPFEIPDSWEWSRLQNYCQYGESASIRVEECSPDSWVLDLEDIVAHAGHITKRVSAIERPSSSNKYSFERGAVLYSKLRPYLNKVVVAEECGCCTTEIIPIRLFSGSSPYFLQQLLMSSFFVSEINKDSYGVKMPRADTKKVKDFLLPIPPLQEQHRIVGKLDALLKLV